MILLHCKTNIYYFKQSINLRIIWEVDTIRHEEKYSSLEILGYADSSYKKDLKDKKSITGYYFFLGREIITWYNS